MIGFYLYLKQKKNTQQTHTNTHHAALRIKSFTVDHFQKTSALPVIGRLSAKLPSQKKKVPFSVFLQSADKILHYWCTLRDCHRQPRPSSPPDVPLTVIYELMHADFDFSWHTLSCSGDWQPTKELPSGSAAATCKNKTAVRGAAVTHCTPPRDADLQWCRCCVCTFLVHLLWSLWRICCFSLVKEKNKTKLETPSEMLHLRRSVTTMKTN